MHHNHKAPFPPWIAGDGIEDVDDMTSRVGARTPGMATGLSLLVPITLSTMAIVLLAPILPQLMAAYSHVPGYEYWVPMVLTMPALCVALLSPVAGVLGDVFGRRRLLILSLALYAVVGIAPLFLTNLWAIIGSRVLVGMAEAMIMVLTTTLIGDYFHGAARDRWLAAQTAVASVSALIFFNLGGFLGGFGWQTPFWVYLSALLMMVAIIVWTWEPSGDAVVSDAADAAGASAHLHAHSSANAGAVAGDAPPFPWRVMGGIIAVTIFASVLFYTVQIQASAGLAVLGLKDPAQIGFYTSIASLGVPVGTMIYSRVSRARVGLLLLVEFGLLAIGFMLMSRADTVPSFLIGCAINQLGAGMLLPTLLVWAMSKLHFAVRGRGAGMWNGAFALGQFLSPIIIAFSAARMGGLLPAFSVLAAASLVACVAAIIMALRRGAPVAAHG
ncbi:MAG: MFS transporter [Sphingopyxis sp.]